MESEQLIPPTSLSPPLSTRSAPSSSPCASTLHHILLMFHVILCSSQFFPVRSPLFFCPLIPHLGLPPTPLPPPRISTSFPIQPPLSPNCFNPNTSSSSPETYFSPLSIFFHLLPSAFPSSAFLSSGSSPSCFFSFSSFPQYLLFHPLI